MAVSNCKELTELLLVLKEHDVQSFEGLGVKVELGRRAPEFTDLSRAEREKLEALEEEDVTFAHVRGRG